MKTFKATAFDPIQGWEKNIRLYIKDHDMLIGFVRELVAYQLSEQKKKIMKEIILNIQENQKDLTLEEYAKIQSEM